MDDNIIKHYSNEDTFQISMEELGGMYKLTLTEIWLETSRSPWKRARKSGGLHDGYGPHVNSFFFFNSLVRGIRKAMRRCLDWFEVFRITWNVVGQGVLGAAIPLLLCEQKCFSYDFFLIIS